MEENLDQRELQLEEKRMILEIAIRVNDLRSGLIFEFLSFKLTEAVTELSVSVTSPRCYPWTTATWRPSPGSAATSAWAPTAPAPAMRWAGIGGELSRDHTAHLWLVRRAPTATAAAPTSGSARPARRTLSHSRTPAKKFRRCGGHTFMTNSIHLLNENRLMLSHCHRVCSWRRFSPGLVNFVMTTRLHTTLTPHLIDQILWNCVLSPLSTFDVIITVNAWTQQFYFNPVLSNDDIFH